MKFRRTFTPFFFVALFLAAAFAALGTQSPQPASALTNCSVSDFSTNSEEQAFLTRINQYRAQNGAPALAISTGLSRMATWHAEDMIANNYFSHTDSLGRSFGTRLSQCDAAGGASAENIAAGYANAAQVFEGWRTSSGHNTNMLNPAYRYIGIARVTGGAYGTYWVTTFSSINPSAGSGGSTATPTPPSTQTPTPPPAAITSPLNGSTLTSDAATFQWSAGSGAAEYFLYVGTSQGNGDLYAASQSLGRSRTVTGLPTDGSTIYVRLWTRLNGSWQYNDYTYRAATVAAVNTQAKLVSPAPGSRLGGNRVTFAWEAGQNASEYFFYAGTSQGSNNIIGASTGQGTSITVGNLPRNGSTVYVRLWTRHGSTWQYSDYTYRAASR